MLDHLHGRNQVELAFQLLHVANAIIDFEAHRRRVLPRDRNDFGGGVQPGHLGAELLECTRREIRVGAVGAVDRDAHAG